MRKREINLNYAIVETRNQHQRIAEVLLILEIFQISIDFHRYLYFQN